MNTKRVFKRKIYNRLVEWKTRSKGTTALLIEGARRIGKSTIVREFAQNEYKSYIFIDFSNASPEVNSLFNDLSDLEAIFVQLQFEYHQRLVPRESVIIFDEVQFNPRARQAIKHLVADGRFDYIETGSLISISKNVKDILIPSEEERLKMYPMDYEEFRWALDDNETCQLLRQAIKSGKPLGQVAHRRMMRDFRLYMLVGGMPQAVNTYLDTLDLSLVDHTKRTIIDLYEADFRKIDNSGRIGRLFDDIPAQLGRNASRYYTKPVIGNISESVEDNLISELAASMTVNMCYNTSNPANGLAMDFDKDFYKMFVHDIGLFVTLAFKDSDFTDNIIYSKLLSDKLDANLGFVYETAVAQILVATGRKLFYYVFPSGTSRHLYEVDFLISKKDKIDPIEVKSSGYKTHKSLDEFCKKYSFKIHTPFIVYTKDVAKDGMMHYLPIYMLPFIDEVL